jgi:hypothetical protein
MLTVYGGSIMTVLYDNRPAIKDIDCMFGETNQKLVLAIASNPSEARVTYMD